MKLLALALLPMLAVAASEKGSEVEKKKIQSNAPGAPQLPNVLLIGDSISMGYAHPVRALLKGKANVVHCATTKGVQPIDRKLGDTKWAVIHFNFGIHDRMHVDEPGDDKATRNPQEPPQATVEKYSENIEIIVNKLKATGARLIFATNTPVPAGTKMLKAGGEVPYNAAALKIMKGNDIAINDLHAFCAPQLDKLQKPHGGHFTDAGLQALAEQVAKAIEAELKKCH